jgi:hypothetical protein
MWVRGLVASMAVHAVVLALLCHEPARLGAAPVAAKDSRSAQHSELASEWRFLLKR